MAGVPKQKPARALTTAEKQAIAQKAAALAEFGKRYRHDPLLYIREVHGVEPDPWQKTVLEAYRKALLGQGKRRISIRSGHGVGKTACLAWIANHHQTFFFPQKTICTAASEGQLKDGLIAELKTWISRMKPDLQAIYEVQVERIMLVVAPDESFISFRVSKAENPEALAGVHSKHVLLIVDEASGVPDAIFESASGSMADPNSIMILAGNMVRNTGVFFDSHFKDVNNDWVKIHISSIDSPRTSRENIEYERTRYGERSNRFRVRVLGEPPLADDDAVIPYDLAVSALERDVGKPMGPIVWGVDVATSGNDASALAKRQGHVLLEKVKTWYGLETMQLVGRIKAEWEMTPKERRPNAIMVDMIGLGAGVPERLRELQLPARGINVSESPSVGDRYKNLRTELWFKGREWLYMRNCWLSGDQDLVDELVGPQMAPAGSSGLMLVESKQHMKARGIPSPNRADAFLLTFAHEYSIGLSGNDKRHDWKQPLKRVIKGLV